MSEASKTLETDRLLLDLYGTDRVKAEEIVNAHARSLELRLTEALDRAQRAEEELDRARDAWSQDAMHKILAMTDDQISACLRLEGKDPKDAATIAKQAAALAIAQVDNEQQSSKIAELEKDAARYRWLREQQTINDSEWCVISQTAPMCVPRDLDAAIDLASSGQGAKGIAKDSGSSDPAS